MCGFTVVLDLQKDIQTDEAANLFKEILPDLKIRGPDAQNYYSRDNVFMAHARLSIIAVETGHQPMLDATHSKAVVFNGEIFNHLSLRNSFPNHNFTTPSDTEILLALEDLNRPQKFLDSLRGMFSFSLVDFKNKRMLVCRDRFGKKPLFVGKLGGKLFASSRIKSIIKALGPTDIKQSAEGLGYFVDFGYIPAPFSIVEGVEKLLPGEWRVYDFVGNILQKGFIEARTLPGDVSFEKARHLSPQDFEEMMRSALDTRLISERPVGLLLSDGIDSSVIAKTLMDLKQIGHGKNIKAIILASGDQYDESKGAVEFAKRLELPYEVIAMDASKEGLEEIFSIMDEPFADLSIFPTFAAFKALKRHATVALTGDGGDELFGGYPYQYQNRYIGNIMRFNSHYGPLRRLKLFKDLPHAASRSSYLYRRISTGGLFHSQYYRDYEKQIPDLRARFENLAAHRPDFKIDGEITLSQWHNSVAIVLSDRMLAKVDVCSMGAGVEARSPFLDEDLWNTVMNSDATQSDQALSQCKTFLKTYIRPYKSSGAKRGFSMDYSRYFEGAEKHFGQRVIGKFLSESEPARLSALIFEKWSRSII